MTMKTWPILLVGIVTVITFVAYAALLLIASWPIEDLSIRNASLFGDSFGVLNSFFTGGAFLLILWTMVLQQEELRLQRQEMSRMVAVHRRQAHMELINYSIHDEELAKVWASDISDWIEFRQNTYVNLIITQWYMGFCEDLLDRDLLETNLKQYMEKSDHFRNYWKRASKYWEGKTDYDPKRLEFNKLCQAAYDSAASGRSKEDTN